MGSEKLSRREREIMDALYETQDASAAEVREKLSGAPSDATVRTLLRILGEKGLIKHRRVGRLFRYRPVKSKKKAAKEALQRVLDVFFDGAVDEAIASHLADPRTSLDEHQLERLRKLIAEARKRDQS